MRFSDIRRSVDGISPRMLTVTLRALERDGLENHHLQSFIRPGPCLHLPSPRVQHSQRRGDAS